MDINKLYIEHSRHLYFASLRILGNPQLAEEAMQEAFVKLHLYNRKESIENIEAWLVQTVVRNSIDLLRREQRERLLKEEYLPYCKTSTGESPLPDETGQARKIALVKHAIMQLPAAQRIAVSLRLLEGYDYSEISQITGTSESSLKSNYMRGKERLAELVREMEKRYI